MPRRPKLDHAPIDDLTPPDEDPTVPDPAGPEPVDRVGRSSGHPIGRRLGISVPGAIGGALLVCTLAFGASLGSGAHVDLREADAPGMTVPDGDAAPTEPGAASQPDGATGDVAAGQHDRESETGATDAHATEPTEAPAPDKVEPTEPKATDRVEPKPTEKPAQNETEKPRPVEKPVLGLTLSLKERAVLVDWTSCEVDGAQAYKVVRSTDSTVRWPAGGGDDLVAVVEVGGATKAWDEHAPAGKKVWYRVFCVRHSGDGYAILAASEAKSIRTPEKPAPTPTPAPEHLSLEAAADGGHIVLHWEACGGDSFSHYRVLRKTTGDATLLTEIGDAGTTTYVDEAVEPGVEYHYLVQCKGHAGDGYVLLGSTEWVGASVE